MAVQVFVKDHAIHLHIQEAGMDSDTPKLRVYESPIAKPAISYSGLFQEMKKEKDFLAFIRGMNFLFKI